jgi:hypothetical protein
MKCIIILLFILPFVNLRSISQARDSLLSIYNNQTIYRSGNKFMKGSEKLSFQDLNIEFNSTETKEYYHKSKSRLTFSRIFNVASLGLAVVSVLTSTNTAGSIKLAVGTGALGIAGLYYHDQFSKYLDKAIRIRNREILFDTSH